MEGYKYRSNFDRDIKLLLQGKIYTPYIYDLNDPFEGIIIPKIFDDYEILKPHLSQEEYKRKITLQNKLLTQIKYVGIYSLSKYYSNELLWSHYSNSHKGFCIEYELNDLIPENTKTLIFPRIINIDYRKGPPIYSLDGSGDLQTKIIRKLIGTKSNSWKYEGEIRIIFLENGEQKINQKAIKSIIFGFHTSKKDINNTINLIQDKVKYYKMELLKNSYKLIKKEIKI